MHQHCISILAVQTVLMYSCQQTPNVCDNESVQHSVQLSHEELRDWLNTLQNQRNALWEARHEVELSATKIHTFQNLESVQYTAQAIKKYISELCHFLACIRDATEFILLHNSSHGFDMPWISNLFAVEDWESEVKEKTVLLHYTRQAVEQFETEQFLYEYIQPITYAIIFVIGFTGNGILFMIFILHKEARTTRNCLIMNLAVADILTLILNLPLTHIYLVTRFKNIGILVCQIFNFSRFLSLGSGIYSIICLATDRYLLFTIMLKQRNTRCQLSKRVVTSLYIVMTWMVSIIVAVPSAIYTAKLRDGSCVVSNDSVTLVIFYFVPYCVVPVCVVPILSILTAHHLRTSANEMPGEGLDTQRGARNRSARMLQALAIVSVMSYVPHLLLCALYAWELIEELNKAVQVYLEFITYCFMFGNVILNPAALYISSTSFRNMINKRMLQCWKCTKKTKSQMNISNVKTEQMTRIPHLS
jgi:hypothetical protein